MRQQAAAGESERVGTYGARKGDSAAFWQPAQDGKVHVAPHNKLALGCGMGAVVGAQLDDEGHPDGARERAHVHLRLAHHASPGLREGDQADDGRVDASVGEGPVWRAAKIVHAPLVSLAG